MSKNFLIVSEDFYSIQGEGPSIGTPSVFLRLAGCNLQCPGFSYKHPLTGEHLGCDTKHVWMQGKKKTFDEIIHHWKEQTWLTKLAQGAHLVITGGEPTLYQEALLGFWTLLDQLAPNIWLEIETNATLLLQPEFLNRLNQINTSPKLAHSGESKEKAYQPEVISQLVETPKAKFKFVVAHPTDIEEIIDNYVKPFNIPTNRIWLMPEGGTRSAIAPKALWLVELCKEYLMNYTPRLHIDIWNEATGV